MADTNEQLTTGEIEREAKFEVGEDFELPDLADAVPGLGPAAPVERLVEDTYYDTDDLRLLRHGATLRNRKRKGWNVKLPRMVSGDALVRDEITVPGPMGTPPEAAVDLVRALTRGRPLEVVARLTTVRTAHTWTNPDGGLLVELVDDRSTVHRDDGEPVSLHQIEVELGPDTDPSVLDRFVELLADAGANPDPTAIKVWTALGRPTLGGPELVVDPLGADPSGRDVLVRALTRSVVQLLAELPAAVAGRDPEGVHQARVATRRLRSDLRTFRPLLDREWADGLRGELRPLAAHLGAVRDLDVLIALFRTRIGSTPHLDADAAAGLFDLLGRHRTGHLDALRAHLREPSSDALLERLVDAATDPAVRDRANQPAAERLPALVRRRWGKVTTALAAAGPSPTPEELHDVRILTKQTRYAAEAVAPAFGKPAKRFSRALAGLQDELGDRNDLVVAEQWLTAHAAEADAAAAFTAGRLAESLRAEVAGPADQVGGDAIHDHWRRFYTEASRERNISWFA